MDRVKYLAEQIQRLNKPRYSEWQTAKSRLLNEDEQRLSIAESIHDAIRHLKISMSTEYPTRGDMLKAIDHINEALLVMSDNSTEE